MLAMTPSTLRRDIRSAVDHGQSLRTIEDSLLGDLPFDPEARDALWLYAWSLTWRRDRRD
jgi:hypothetical protein